MSRFVSALLGFGMIMLTSFFSQAEPSLREKLGQMVMVGFHGDAYESPWIKTLVPQIAAGELGGVILFKYNLAPERLPSLIDSLQAQAKIPLFVAVDQEGGRVKRFAKENGFEDFPSAYSLATQGLAVAKETYARMAALLARYKVNMVFGPVVDLDHDPSCPVIGGLERSYGKEVETVVQYAQTFLEAMAHHKIVCFLKHFPGHGSAQGDTHKGFVDTTDVWTSKELEPYRRLISAPGVMTAHITNSHLDKSMVPASLSQPVVTELLRKQIAFPGIVITDDLHMGAILDTGDLAAVAIQAVLAGNDILLLSNNPAAVGKSHNPEQVISPTMAKQVVDILEAAVGAGKISQARIDESYQRVIQLKQQIFFSKDKKEDL